LAERLALPGQVEVVGAVFGFVIIVVVIVIVVVLFGVGGPDLGFFEDRFLFGVEQVVDG